MEICLAKALLVKKKKKGDTLDLVMCLIFHLHLDLLIEAVAVSWPLALDDQGTPVAF